MAALLAPTSSLSAEDAEGGYRLLKLDGYKVKWGEQTLGVGASIRYAFADDTLRFDNARNCSQMAPMKALAGEDLSFQILERETAAAFEVWERAADLSFHLVADARDADIVVAHRASRTGGHLLMSLMPRRQKRGVRAIQQSLVCLNPNQKWKVGFDGNKNVYDIRYTLIHEIGHAIGLDHPGPAGQVMGFRYTEEFPDLQPGDLRGVLRLYGRAADNSNTLAAADIPE